MSNDELSWVRAYYEQNKYFTIKLAIGLVAALMFWMVLLPGVTELLRKWQKIDEFQSKVQEAQSWQQISSRLVENNRALAAKVTAVHKEGSSEELLSGIIRLIHGKARQAGVRFTQLRPKLLEGAGTYQDVTIEMALRGRYHELTEFVYHLESVPYITQVQHLSFSTPDMLSREISAALRISFLMTPLPPARTAATKAKVGATRP